MKWLLFISISLILILLGFIYFKGDNGAKIKIEKVSEDKIKKQVEEKFRQNTLEVEKAEELVNWERRVLEKRRALILEQATWDASQVKTNAEFEKKKKDDDLERILKLEKIGRIQIEGDARLAELNLAYEKALAPFEMRHKELERQYWKTSNYLIRQEINREAYGISFRMVALKSKLDKDVEQEKLRTKVAIEACKSGLTQR